MALLAGVVAAGPAMAGTVPYVKLMAAQIAFQAMPPEQRDKIRLRMRVAHEDGADHRPIHLWVEDGDVKTDIPMSPDGAIDMPLSADWVARAVMVRTDQKQGSLHADVDIGIDVPASRPIPVAYLRDAIRQAQFVLDAGARHAAGFLAMFVTPKVRGLKLAASPCCSQTTLLTGGAQAELVKQGSDGAFRLDEAVLAEHEGGALAVTATVIAIDPWLR